MPEFEENKGFKMKGWSGYQNSPVRDTEEEAGKKHQHPHTKEEQEGIERKKGKLEDRITLTAENKKLIAERKALYDAGEITKEQFESDKEEISKYIDY
tara:strand:- start:58 stop:351 length:294 start_codon:yes stop_codon:yes gene_type:complete